MSVVFLLMICCVVMCGSKVFFSVLANEERNEIGLYEVSKDDILFLRCEWWQQIMPHPE